MRRVLVCILAVAVFAVRAHAGEEKARIAKIAGKAEIFRAGEWNETWTGHVLEPGDAVRVAADGRVEIETSDGKIGVSGENGAVIEYDGVVAADVVPWKDRRLARAAAQTSGENGNATQQFSCPAGTIEVRVRTGEPLRVVTPLLTASVRGTRFAMRVAADGSSSLRLEEGAVDGHDRTGSFRRVAPGGEMNLASSDFVRYLGVRGVAVAPGQDWRLLSPSVLDAVDNATFSGTFSQVFYNPVLGQVVKAESGQEGVDESRVAKAAYIGDATLEEILANPDANPFAPEWLDELAANPLTDAENGRLSVVYPGGDFAIEPGPLPGGPGSSLITNGTPNRENAQLSESGSGGDSGFPGNPSYPGLGPGVARVSGKLGSGPSSSNVNGSFGFNLDVNSGGITNGRMSGNGKNGASQQFGFGMSGGTGTYSGNSFTVGNFSGNVNNNPVGAGTSLSGTAPSGLGQRGDPVGGSFTVVDGNTLDSLTGSFTGNRVN